MAFSPVDSTVEPTGVPTIRPVPRPSVSRVPGGSEPIANFASIRKESETRFTIVHSENEEENLSVEIRV